MGPWAPAAEQRGGGRQTGARSSGEEGWGLLLTPPHPSHLPDTCPPSPHSGPALPTCLEGSQERPRDRTWVPSTCLMANAPVPPGPTADQPPSSLPPGHGPHAPRNLLFPAASSADPWGKHTHPALALLCPQKEQSRWDPRSLQNCDALPHQAHSGKLQFHGRPVHRCPLGGALGRAQPEWALCERRVTPLVLRARPAL